MHKIWLISLLSLVFAFLAARAEDPDTVWTKRYVGLTCVKFSPDGKKILGAYGNTILEIDALTGERIRKFENWGGSGAIISMGITKSFNYLFSRNDDGKTKGWDISTGKSLQDIGYHDVIKNEAGFCVHPSENKVYFCYGDTISLFDIESRKTESVHFLFGQNCSYIAVSKDNKYLAFSVSYYDGGKSIYLQKILIVDTKDFSIIKEIKGNIYETLALDFSYDSKYLAYLTSENGAHIVNIYDINQKTTNKYYYSDFNSTPISIKFAKERNLLIVSGGDINRRGNTSIVDNNLNKVLYTINYGGWQGCVDVSSNNQIIIQDNYDLVLINTRWFTTDVNPNSEPNYVSNITADYDDNKLKIANPLNKNIIGIKIFDITGALVKTFDAGFTGEKIEIPFSARAGLYLAKISTDYGDYSYKFIISN